MKQLKLFLIISFLFFSCKKDNTPDPGPTPVAEKTELNVSYGTDAAQKMDIYLPASRTTTSTKVIILIHGGGWTQGDKADFTSYVDTLKKRLPGYAIFNINYRLATGTSNFFPAQENDVKAAIEFIYGKRAEYLISDKFVLLGASAGGHLSLLHAYKYTTPVKIKAVVDFFGPTDLVDMYNNPPNPLIPILLLQVTGGNPATLPAMYQQSGPINYVTAQSPPTILLHGGVDVVVSYTQSVMLKNKLTTFGVVNQYVFYPTENHGWTGANLTDSFDKITTFLNTNVN
ncbi:MAG: alpha/beta hydrolase [Sphingobacteriales bacterium]|nr:alpha/beta hydrolase [Sphingobacteriales bacterium]